jgi:hypothetical protein
MPSHVSIRLAAALLGISPQAVQQLLASRLLANEAKSDFERRTMARISMHSIERRLHRPITPADYMAAKERLLGNEGRRLCAA